MVRGGIAIAAVVAGGAVAVAGLVGVLVNRPRTVLSEEGQASLGVSAFPVVTSGGAGVSLRVTF